MKKYSYILLSLVLGNTAFDIQAVKFNDSALENKAQEEVSETKFDAIGKAVGHGLGVLIAPRLYLTSGNVTPHDANNNISFYGKDGGRIESVKVIDAFMCQGNKIENNRYDPSSNFVIYLLERPVKSVKPVTIAEGIPEHSQLYVFSKNRKKVVLGVNSIPSDIEERILISKSTNFELEHTKDGSSPLFAVDRNDQKSQLKLVGIWSSSPNAENTQQDAYIFTNITAHLDDIKSKIVTYQTIKLVVGEEATVRNKCVISGADIENAKQYVMPYAFNIDAQEFGQYVFAVKPNKANELQEIIVIDPRLNHRAIKIHNVGNMVKVTSKDNHFTLVAVDANGKQVHAGQCEGGDYQFDAAYGVLSISIQLKDQSAPLTIRFDHKV